MLRIIWCHLLFFAGASLFGGEMNQVLQDSHSGVEKTARQLSGAIESLNHALGTDKRPVASALELSADTVLNGLKQQDLDPLEDPKNSFDNLKKRHERLAKELNKVVVELAVNESKSSEDKSISIQKVLEKERENLRGEKRKIEIQIKEKVESVLNKMGFSSVAKGSTTYQRDQETVSVRFERGKIIVSPIKALPPVNSER